MLRLELDGWNRYEELKRAGAASGRAFMAMPFGNPTLDNVYNECFKPAVRETGFELYRADEKPEAGLIDDRIREAVLTSRFLIAELTGDNSGVYWEAGHAEAMSKPVIYTCERAYFEEHGTHFDTRNRQTIIWAEDELEDAAARLKASIRATLPVEAVLEDPPE